MLNSLRHSLFGCNSAVKSLAYTSIIRPHLEYANIVWNTHASSDINLLEAVQNWAAHWICAIWDRDTYSWSTSSSTCLGELKWPSLAQRWTYFPLIIFIVYCFTRTPSYSKTILNLNLIPPPLELISWLFNLLLHLLILFIIHICQFKFFCGTTYL